MKKIILFLFLGFLSNHTFAQSDSIYMVVEQMPMFPGCHPDSLKEGQTMQKCSESALLNFIYNEIKYPEAARDSGTQGTVVTRFVIEKDGSISNIQLLRDLDNGCGEEALRVVNLINEQGKKWQPARIDGKPVRYQFNLPIRYKLEEEKKQEQNLFVYFVFCRDFVGEFFQKDFLQELSVQVIDNSNLCAEGIELRKISITYEKDDVEVTKVEGEGWTPEVGAIFAKAEVGGVFNMVYTLGKGEAEIEVTKVLMVE